MMETTYWIAAISGMVTSTIYLIIRHYRTRCDYSEWSPLVGCYGGVFQFRKCRRCGKIISRKHGCSNEVNLAKYSGEDNETND